MLPESILSWGFVIYISYVGVIITLFLHYTYIFIDMFVHNITVNELINLIIGCTLYCVFLYISPVCEIFYHCVVITYALDLICLRILYLCQLQYVCVICTT